MNARQIKRLENKKRKMDALLEIKTLNDADKQVKRSHLSWKDNTVKKKSKLMLYLKHQGESAQIRDTGLPQSRIPLFASDIRDFLLYIVFNKTCPPYTEPRWCNISKKTINHTILLVNEGLSMNDYLRYSFELPGLRDRFVKLEVVPPSSYETSLVQELVMSSRQREAQDVSLSHSDCSPTSRNSKLTNFSESSHTIRSAFPIDSQHSAPIVLQQPAESAISHDNTPVTSQQQTVPDKFPRTMLLLSALQMIEEDYPIPLRGELSTRFSKYRNTKEMYAEVTPLSPLYGLDCEMCQTAHDQTELTRVTLVDEQENVVYESLVKPYNPITNYLTAFSGITRALLDPVATRLEHVQAALSELLPADAILVGQSLNCDLHALKMMHPYVIDTSVIFNTAGSRIHKPKLKLLASHFLGLDIQNRGPSGHCSREDAVAALKLVQLKLSKDPQFGDSVALQKCIRNINSQLSSAYEVQNLFAYFDKIVTKKQDLRVERTAIVLTTDGATQSDYKKYLQTYRTKCKLINRPNSNTLSNKEARETLNGKRETSSIELIESNGVHVMEHRELSENQVKTLVNMSSTNKSLTNESSQSCIHKATENSNISSIKSSSCKIISSKRKISSTDSSCASERTLKIDSASLEDTIENQGSPPNKLKRRSKSDMKNKSKSEKDVQNESKLDNSNLSVSDVSISVDQVIELDCTKQFTDPQSAHSKIELDNGNHTTIDAKEIPEFIKNKPSEIICLGEKNSLARNIKDSNIALAKREITCQEKIEEPTVLSRTHKDLIDEMLVESKLKSLVIGHTKQPNRRLFLDMVEVLENGLDENVLLVILCVPSCESDQSSGVCFVSANSC